MNFLRYFCPTWLRAALPHGPSIEGKFALETREGGKLRTRREGKNIWTLTGREYLAELIALQATSSSRTTYREDRVRYFGLGTGSQPEVAEVSSLVSPVEYVSGVFLAPTYVPVIFPTSPRTSVQFAREYGTEEISIGAPATAVILTEAGLFTDGDQNSNWALDTFDPAFATASAWAPVAYKTFEPVTKTTSFTLRLTWEIRFV